MSERGWWFWTLMEGTWLMILSAGAVLSLLVLAFSCSHPDGYERHVGQFDFYNSEMRKSDCFVIWAVDWTDQEWDELRYYPCATATPTPTLEPTPNPTYLLWGTLISGGGPTPTPVPTRPVWR